MTKKLYAIILNNKIVGDLIHGGRAIYESESEAKEKLNFISTYAIEYFSNQGIEPYPKSSYSIKEYILKKNKKKIQNKKKLDIMGNLFAKLSNSKIPDKYIIKLYTKKELYQKIQQYIQTICQLKQKLEEKEKEIEILKNLKTDEMALKAIQEAISIQSTNNYPQIFIQDMESGRVFEYGKNCHDRLVISEDGRSLHYANLQNGDGSKFGNYRFYYEKPLIETEMDKAHEFEIDYYARHLHNEPLEQENQTQLAIKELEKLRNNILINQKGDDGWTSLEVDLQYLVDMINEQIEKLEGEK